MKAQVRRALQRATGMMKRPACSSLVKAIVCKAVGKWKDKCKHVAQKVEEKTKSSSKENALTRHAGGALTRQAGGGTYQDPHGRKDPPTTAPVA